MHSVASLKIYRRGVPSALVKLCGNPHGKIVLLRRAVYAKLEIKEKVREEWPEWKENKVEWHNEEVTPDTEALSYFELSPQALFEKFFSDEKRPNCKDLEDWEWENHIFAYRSIVFELWLIGQKDRKDETLFSLLTKVTETSDSDVSNLAGEMSKVSLSTHQGTLELAPDSCENFRKTGRCKFGDTCFNSSGHKICPYNRQGVCRRGQNCLFYH